MFHRFPFGAVITMTVSLLFLTAALSATEVQEGVVVAAGNSSISMTDIYGENTRSYVIAPNARIFLDGSRAKLEDLKMGDRVIVTMRQKDRHMKVATRVDAHAGT